MGPLAGHGRWSLGCVAFETLPLGSRVTKQARGFVAIAFYALMKNRKLKIRRNGRTETAGPVRPRASLGGPSPAGRGRGGPVPAGAPAPGPGALTGGRRRPLARSGVPRSLGPARAGMDGSGRRSGRSGQAGLPGPRHAGSQPDGALSPLPFLYLRRGETQRREKAPGPGPRPFGAAHT